MPISCWYVKSFCPWLPETAVEPLDLCIGYCSYLIDCMRSLFSRNAWQLRCQLYLFTCLLIQSGITLSMPSRYLAVSCISFLAQRDRHSLVVTSKCLCGPTWQLTS